MCICVSATAVLHVVFAVSDIRHSNNDGLVRVGSRVHRANVVDQGRRDDRNLGDVSALASSPSCQR